MQARRSFPTSSMLVVSLEKLQEYRAVISLGFHSDLAGPIFTKFLKSHDAFKFLSIKILHIMGQ